MVDDVEDVGDAVDDSFWRGQHPDVVPMLRPSHVHVQVPMGEHVLRQVQTDPLQCLSLQLINFRIDLSYLAGQIRPETCCG